MVALGRGGVIMSEVPLCSRGIPTDKVLAGLFNSPRKSLRSPLCGKSTLFGHQVAHMCGMDGAKQSARER